MLVHSGGRYWFKWPAEKLRTRDGGVTYRSTQGYQFELNFETSLAEWHHDYMPENFVQAGATPRGRKVFLMPTRSERVINLLRKYKEMGETLESPFPDGTEPTEIVTFHISMLFDLHQITTLSVKYRKSKGGASTTALCSELMQFPDAVIKRINKHGLEAFLQRNDEKRITVLHEKCLDVWGSVKEALYQCPVPSPEDEAEEPEPEPHMPTPVSSAEPAAAQASRPDAIKSTSDAGANDPPVDDTTMRRKVRATWKEYVALKDVVEAVECFKEFAHPVYNSVAVHLM